MMLPKRVPLTGVQTPPLKVLPLAATTTQNGADWLHPFKVPPLSGHPQQLLPEPVVRVVKKLPK